MRWADYSHDLKFFFKDSLLGINHAVNSRFPKAASPLVYLNLTLPLHRRVLASPFIVQKYWASNSSAVT